MTCTIKLGDVGTQFKATIIDCDTGAIIDLSTATTKTLTFKKPDGTTVVKSAEFFTDGTDGIITYTTIENDIDIRGGWSVQGYVENTFFSNKSDIKRFKVEKNL